MNGQANTSRQQRRGNLLSPGKVEVPGLLTEFAKAKTTWSIYVGDAGENVGLRRPLRRSTGDVVSISAKFSIVYQLTSCHLVTLPTFLTL
jgi:hypothetical protein